MYSSPVLPLNAKVNLAPGTQLSLKSATVGATSITVGDAHKSKQHSLFCLYTWTNQIYRGRGIFLLFVFFNLPYAWTFVKR